MIIVSDASPLMNLAAISQLQLLREIYGRIIIPPKVFQELTVQGRGQPGDSEVRNAKWIEVQEPSDRILISELSETIDVGEAEAIALAVELQCSKIIIDERLGRKKAQEMNLHVIGTLGVLVEAKQRHLIPSVISLMDELRTKAHFRIREELYYEIKQTVGE